MAAKVLLALIYSCFFSFQLLMAQSPITIERADMPMVGTKYHFSSAIPGTDITQALTTGQNHIWNLANLRKLQESADSFQSLASVPLIFRAMFFNSSNLALKQNNNFQIPDTMLPIEVGDIFQFYNNSNSNYSHVGFGVEMGGFGIPVVYQQKDVLYNFPLQYGKIDSSTSHFDLQFPGMFYYEQTQQRKNTVDGWGTLVTPYGTFNTIRVKSEIWATDSIQFDTMPGFRTERSKQIEYKWLAKGKGQPLLTIYGTEIMGEFVPVSIMFQDSARTQKPTSAFRPKINTGFSFYPNPAVETITLSFEKEALAEIKIVDLTGKTVLSDTRLIGSSGTLIDISSLRAGMYVLHITTENGHFVNKLVVVK